jgi:dienelactone hydrolase
VHRFGFPNALCVSLFLITHLTAESQPIRARQFEPSDPSATWQWQRESRDLLFRLMMGGRKPEAIPLAPQLLHSEQPPGTAYRLEEISFQSTPAHRAHAWLAVPTRPGTRRSTVLALHGHGGSGEDVVRGRGLYWYGRALAEMGCVVIAPDIGQHTLRDSNWSLMGERTWDALRCLDYLGTRSDVDTNSFAVVGLSLGAETAMYVSALDERVQLACCSGWLTTVENMKQGHCPCWNFPGLEAHFDFADIFACVAPRTLILEIGEQEPAQGGFPLTIARPAFEQIRPAYQILGAPHQAQLEVHPGGHVFSGQQLGATLAIARNGPADRDPTMKSLSIERAYLQATARELLMGSQVTAHDGTVLYTPDGKGNYRALWTRDFAYMVEYAGDLIPLDHIEAALHYLIRGIRADGAAPDRVRPDGVAVHTAGPDTAPIGRPNIDNAQFLAILTDECLRRLPPARAASLFEEWSGPLDRALDYIPRSGAGLVYNDPADPHSPYGFTDTVGKTGELFFESLLYWTASQRMAAWHRRHGIPDRAEEYARGADRIVTALGRLWDDKQGVFLAATEDCRQIDIWGNAYVIYLGLPLGDKRPRILDFLTSQSNRFVWRGQVRHLPADEHWERLLTPIEPERYQNGAYWAAASGWMMVALAQEDPELARRMWRELLADFQTHGVCECINHDYRQLPSYVVSATNPLAAAQRLGW